MSKASLHKALKYSAVVFLIGGALFIAMVQQFAHTVSAVSKTQPSINHDQWPQTGIVIATGSEGRVDRGLALMLAYPAKRLLISGTGAGVGKADILRVSGKNNQFNQDQLTALFDCCVDLDPAATNTLGNAIESQIWAEAHDLSSLVLVTSDFHMPRALIIFQQVMPRRDILPHHVVSDWLIPDQYGALGWWRSTRRIEIISREMIKYYANLI